MLNFKISSKLTYAILSELQKPFNQLKIRSDNTAVALPADTH